MPPAVRPDDLPRDVPMPDLAALAYPAAVADVAAALLRRLPCLVECPKEVVPFFARAVRAHLAPHKLKFTTLDGRAATPDRTPLLSTGLIGNMRHALLEAARGAVAGTVVVLPHLDLMAGGGPAATAEARELAAALVENPDLVWVGFRDPLTPLPRLLERLPLFRARVGGVPRDRLRFLVTQREGRKLGAAVDLGRLFRAVSGLNAVQLRKYLASLDREDRPADPAAAFAELRRLTLPPGAAVPNERLGASAAAGRLRGDVLELLDRAAGADAEADRDRLEALVPRGVLLAGPPGVGKRTLARGLAGELGAVFLETTGAELKSRFLGGSEENLRLLFAQARQAAPAVLLFKELDAFAARPGRGAAEPSLFLQLLQELDALPRGELVLVVGTVADAGAVDPSLLQPGRFELTVTVNPPTPDETRALLESLAATAGLTFGADGLTRAVERCCHATPTKPPFHAARVAALVRALARAHARGEAAVPLAPACVDRAWDGL